MYLLFSVLISLHHMKSQNVYGVGFPPQNCHNKKTSLIHSPFSLSTLREYLFSSEVSTLQSFSEFSPHFSTHIPPNRFLELSNVFQTQPIANSASIISPPAVCSTCFVNSFVDIRYTEDYCSNQSIMAPEFLNTHEWCGTSAKTSADQYTGRTQVVHRVQQGATRIGHVTSD